MDVDSTVDSGLELMKHISNDEAIQLKDKLDSLQRRYRDLVSRGADLLKTAQVRSRICSLLCLLKGFQKSTRCAKAAPHLLTPKKLPLLICFPFPYEKH